MKKKKNSAGRRLVVTLPLLPTQAATPLPRLTPSSHGAQSPPNTSAWTSDCYTRVIVRQNGVGGYRLIGKSEACQEICCPELPSAPDSPSNHQSWVKKKGKKKHPPSTVSSTRCQHGTSQCRRFLHCWPWWLKLHFDIHQTTLFSSTFFVDI